LLLLKEPEAFDVIVTYNLFGDILTDLGAALCGGLGIAASANINPGHVSMFEPVHGSAPDIAGKGIANPLAAILSAALLLEHLGCAEEAKAVEVAVRRVVQQGPLTPDLGGQATTGAVAAAVLAQLADLPAAT
jgi:isocitrate/isopropylmalate dehydrogenase